MRKRKDGFSGPGRLRTPMIGHTRLVLPMVGSHRTQLIFSIPISVDEARIGMLKLVVLNLFYRYRIGPCQWFLDIYRLYSTTTFVTFGKLVIKLFFFFGLAYWLLCLWSQMKPSAQSGVCLAVGSASAHVWRASDIIDRDRADSDSELSRFQAAYYLTRYFSSGWNRKTSRKRGEREALCQHVFRKLYLECLYLLTYHVAILAPHHVGHGGWLAWFRTKSGSDTYIPEVGSFYGSAADVRFLPAFRYDFNQQ